MIFLLSSYLWVNDEVSFIVEVFIYILIFLIAFISLYLYKSIHKNLKQQEKNSIQIEINQLKSKLKKHQDEKIVQSIKAKIKILEKEIVTIK